jgi:transposase
MMLPLLHVFVFLTAVDMRKSIDGLSLLVQSAGFSWADAAAQSLGFAFFSKDRSKIKLLVWDVNGFWVCYKRLEKGTFRVPEQTRITQAELWLLVQGVDLRKHRIRSFPLREVA